ncbi:hypothetical protein [Nocardioides xinjiangensis]|uniref:hypothetical protein n=1 Tax=Nocardioides xinjiangensis TaxID=2817376 RepID=UPI001B317096|nr:hypothetical protein [Nocardioides sp. SYSU D00514]
MAEYLLRWRSLTPLADYVVWEGRETHAFPVAVELLAEGQKGAPDVRIKFEVRDAVPEVVDFRMTASAKGRAVRTADFAAWQLEGLALNAFTQFAHATDPDEGDPRPGPKSEREFWQVNNLLTEARATRRGPSEAELEDVARIYREAINHRPTEAVQLRFGYSRRTAARRIQQARAAGLLPKTTPGKKKG